MIMSLYEKIRVREKPIFCYIYLRFCPYTRKYESEKSPYSAIYIYDSVLIRENMSQRKTYILGYISTILSLYEKIRVREKPIFWHILRSVID